MLNGNRYLRILKAAGQCEILNAYVPSSSLYLGIDLTSSSLHLGHIYLLLLLEGLVDRGHTVFIVLGDFTSIVGDPTDRKEERETISSDSLANNLRSIEKQVRLFSPKFVIVKNSDWLGKLTIYDFLHLGKKFSLNETLHVSYYSNRLLKGSRISLTELNYRLLQSYDFYYLNLRHNVSCQVSGVDQRSNVIGGLRLINKKDPYAIFIKLLTDCYGKKFSKSSDSIQPWWNVDLCDHLDFFRVLSSLREFRLLGRALGYVTYVPFFKLIMSRRGWKSDLSLLNTRSILYQRDLTLVKLLVKYFALKNGRAARFAVENRQVKINDLIVTSMQEVKPFDKVTLGKNFFILVDDKRYGS